MKKFFEAPVVEITTFAVEDVVTTSSPTCVNEDNNCLWDGGGV